MLMFAYPKQAEVNRVVPKSKIYAHAKTSKRLKELFVNQVGEILWKYKLSPETINLPARNGINEIQVFEIATKTPNIDEDVLLSIDKAIPFPLVFQLVHDGKVQFAVSYKRPSDADSSKWVIESTFRTEPEPENAERPVLPVALDLASLYEQILHGFSPVPPRRGEGIRDHVARLTEIQKKKEERSLLQTKLRKEKQFNRKVQLNAALRSISHELENLK